MSDEKKASGQIDNDSVNVEENKQEDKVSHATYLKVLGEKKKRDQELAEYKAKLEAIEQEKLESQGKLKELNDNLKKQLAEKDGKLKNMFQEFGTKTLKSKFELEAKSLGCIDPDALYKLVDLNTVEIGDDFSFNQEQLKTVLGEAQKSRSYLFKKDAVATKDAAPSSGNNKSEGLKGKSVDELAKLYKETYNQ
jgi:hypothetical protein